MAGWEMKGEMKAMEVMEVMEVGFYLGQ